MKIETLEIIEVILLLSGILLIVAITIWAAFSVDLMLGLLVIGIVSVFASKVFGDFIDWHKNNAAK